MAKHSAVWGLEFEGPPQKKKRGLLRNCSYALIVSAKSLTINPFVSTENTFSETFSREKNYQSILLNPPKKESLFNSQKLFPMK